MSQKEEAREKLSELKEQIDLGGGDSGEGDDSGGSDALSAMRVDERLGTLGEMLGRRLGARLGRRLGARLGRMVTQPSGKSQEGSEDEGTEEEDEGAEGEGEEEQQEGEDEGEEAEDEEGGEEAEGEEEEQEAGGEQSLDVESMSDEELQSLAETLLDQLEERTGSEG